MRYYEVTNHLGNVLAVINDRRMVESGEYVAVVINANDYYPFGMVMPGRSVTNEAYRYAYNGMEVDNEVKGNGNSYTTEFRQYDPRLGRWLSLDPLMGNFPWMSPYVAFDNNPVFYVDPFGLSSTGKGDPVVVVGKGGENQPGNKYKGDDGKMHKWKKGDQFITADKIYTSTGKRYNKRKSRKAGSVVMSEAFTTEDRAGQTFEGGGITVNLEDHRKENLPEDVKFFLSDTPVKRAKAVIHRGDIVKIVTRTAAEGGIKNTPAGVSAGTITISVPSNAQLGTWNREVRTAEEGLKGGLGLGAGFFIKMTYNVEIDGPWTGNSLIGALRNNIGKLNESRAGILGNVGYLKIHDKTNRVTYRVHGKGTGMNIGLTNNESSLNNLYYTKMSRLDSISVARQDSVLYDSGGGKEYLQSIGVKR
jgi:RHS repeat-associated protein